VLDSDKFSATLRSAVPEVAELLLFEDDDKQASFSLDRKPNFPFAYVRVGLSARHLPSYVLLANVLRYVRYML